MKVTVTEDDIKFGIPKCSESCPVAIAIKRLYPDRVVKVGITGIYLVKDGITHVYKMPKEITVAITSYDYGKPMTPVEFEAPWEEAFT